MLTKTQTIKFGNTEMLLANERRKENSTMQRHYEQILNAYDDMLLGNGNVNADYENYVHTDIITDIADILSRNRLDIEFFNQIDLIYDWSVNYCKNCIDNNVEPVSKASHNFLKSLKYRMVVGVEII